ncbi:AAA family ATPase [Vagococcus fluvialis]|uniref:AAA family ATPase n=1 Tax=Vagococcus fluvialis TaxID=2738 RepID=UPI001D0BAC27|nr:AAA family ATPase [Vagococcus fluvialis]UDM80389.1 AAA family ATPase [Vagococcus fluvialis]
MIIQQLKMTNFRQFYGENELEFGHDDKNVTIIMGANGNGKTGVFRAVMFAMYGDQVIDQDELVSDINLVNLDKLEEADGRPVRASVELYFEFNEDSYQVKREVVSIKDKSSIQTTVGNIQLLKKQDTEDWNPISEDPDEFINHILEKEIREFFFFDAEKMQLLDTAKTTKNISQEVKNGIIRLLQIKSLDDGSRLLKSMVAEKNNQIKNKAKDITLDQKINKKKEQEEELSNNEELERLLISEKQMAQKEIEDIEIKLSDTVQIRELLEEKNQEIRVLQLQKSGFKEKKNNAKSYISEMSQFLAQDLLIANEAHFQGIQEEKHDKIPLELIEETIQGCQCSLCQTKIENGSTQYEMLVKLKEEYLYTETTPIINSILRLTQLNNKDKPFRMNRISKKISEIAREEETINETELKISRLETKIGVQAANQDDLKRLENTLVSTKAKIEDMEESIRTYNYKKDINLSEIKSLDKEINQLMSKLSSVRQDQAIKNKLEDMLEILDNVTSEYTSQSIELLSSEMTNTLHKLLDEKDRYIFKEVKIDPNFEMEVIDENGVNRLPDLSMGQGQIFTLTFILSLAKIASKGRSEVNFPLFMDTPFGRLSRNNRDNLISSIPILVNQWILLLTDTELTSIERDAFHSNDKVGFVFELDNKDGKTKIIKKESILDLKIRG